MGFLILIIVFLFIASLGQSKSKPQYTGVKEKNWCPPHKWVYEKIEDKDVMICLDCRRKPGYSPRE